MIGLDTNVLLRLFLEDDLVQVGRARHYFMTATKNEPALVNPVVLAEFVWTVSKGLKLTKSRVVSLVDAMLNSDDLKVAHHDCAERALTAFKTGSADFADYFLSYINIELGCTSTATFDLKALTSPNFTSVP